MMTIKIIIKNVLHKNRKDNVINKDLRSILTFSEHF